MFTDFSTYFKETAHESNEISRDIFSIQKYLHNYIGSIVFQMMPYGETSWYPNKGSSCVHKKGCP